MAQVWLLLLFVLNYLCIAWSENGIGIDITVESLIEYNSDGEQVLSYTQFTDDDWLNSTLFQPDLLNMNSSCFQLIITSISSNEGLQYIINIKDWKWRDIHNSIECCLHIESSSMDDLHIVSVNQASINTFTQNTVDICYLREYEQEIVESGHIYYHVNDVINEAYNVTNDAFMNISSEFDMTRYHPWLFGVGAVIGFVICIFIALIVYLMKEGFFDDDKRKINIQNKKRKRTNMIIINNKRTAVPVTSATNSSVSGTNSPKKNLRINIQYHCPKQTTDSLNFYPFQTETDQPLESIKELSTTNVSSTYTCNTKIIHQSYDFDAAPLFEGDEETDNEEEEEEEINNDVTPAASPTDDTFEHTQSMIEYVINCNDTESSTAPYIQ